MTKKQRAKLSEAANEASKTADSAANYITQCCLALDDFFRRLNRGEEDSVLWDRLNLARDYARHASTDCMSIISRLNNPHER